MPSPLSATRRRVHRILVAVLAGILVLVAAPPLARAQGGVEVRITSTLEPALVTVAPGTTVTWVNADAERHRVRSIDGPEELDSGNLEQGERFSHTFRAEGTTSYVDHRDEDDTAHHGTVVVTADASPQPQPEPDTTGPSEPQPEPETTGPSGPSGSETHAVSMADRRFAPATLAVTTGDTVRFVNDDDREHTATADDRSFDSGILAQGEEFERTFTQAGTYSYLCLLHPDMTGTIAVADRGGSAPPPAAAPERDATSDPTPAPPPPPSGTPQASDDGASAPQRATVQMRDFSFGPATLEVTAGSTVVFENVGRGLHTATADDGSFDSDLVSPGGSHHQRFDQPGTFAYTCLLHPEMVGEVVVTAVSGGASPVDPPPAAAAGRSGTPDAAAGDVGPDEHASSGGAADPTLAVAGTDGGGLPTWTLELLVLGAFAVALAGFTAVSRRVGAWDGAVDG